MFLVFFLIFEKINSTFRSEDKKVVKISPPLSVGEVSMSRFHSQINLGLDFRSRLSSEI